MKQFFILSFCIACIQLQVYSNAVAIINASTNQNLVLISSVYQVDINNQVATVISTQTFKNTLDSAVTIKYAFPLFEDAAATQLRWNYGGIWYTANFSTSPGDTTLPGTSGETDPDLLTYLGETPLYFNLSDSIFPGETIVFEITYVQLLEYGYNMVSMICKNDYSLIQTSPVEYQELQIDLVSERSITLINLVSHTPDISTFTTNNAIVHYSGIDEVADLDYYFTYSLDPDELGIFSFSTFLPDSLNVCDSLGNGFFAFIIEPDPSDSIIIEKVFTLIIDRSGSMSGIKMTQAIEASSFIIENLNMGDKFNVVDFSTDVSALFDDHVPVTISNQNTALSYIAGLSASGSTNISGSFTEAISQYADSDPGVANIIIFLTDGQASEGITSTSGILSHIAALKTDYDVEGLSIFCFGIGGDVNHSLLSQIAADNDGEAVFFASGDLLEVVTEFYLTIQSPVLLDITMSFDPDVIYETYPSPLPNLYRGRQLIVVGRYDVPGTITVMLDGFKYGEPVTYTYEVNLSDTLNPSNQFLTKLWAIKKIDNLMYDYYAATGTIAEDIKDSIIDMSLCYSVISPFTSFTENGADSGGSVEIEFAGIKSDNVIQVYPNPFTDFIQISISGENYFQASILIYIYDMQGKLITVLTAYNNGTGYFIADWNGEDLHSKLMQSGMYLMHTELFGYTLIEKL